MQFAFNESKMTKHVQLDSILGQIRNFKASFELNLILGVISLCKIFENSFILIL